MGILEREALEEHLDSYEEGYREGFKACVKMSTDVALTRAAKRNPHKKRKLSAWNKYVKANSKKPRFKYRSGKLNLKKMAIAFRKTPAGKKKGKR